jgi:translocation and assembly module TamB
LKQRGFWQRFAVALLVLSGALAVVVVVLVATEPGRVALARIAAQAASAPERRIALTGLASPRIGTLSASGITISDENGAWLTADNVTVRWSPRRLLRATLGIEALSFERIAVARRPATTGDNDLPAPPNLPLWLDIGTLGAPHIELAAPVVGVADTVSLLGWARVLPGDAGPIVEGAIEIARIADAAAQLKLAWSYSAAAGMLSVEGRLNQPANGTLQTILGMKGELPLTATLTGNGDLSDWRGEFAIDAGQSSGARGTATISRDRRGALIAASVDADLSRAFTGAVAELLAGRAHLDLSLRRTDGTMSIDTFDFRSPVATVAATGSVDAGRSAWAAKFTAAVPNSDALRSLLPATLAFRDLAVEGNLSGSASSAAGTARLAAGDAEFGAFAADRMQATLTPGKGGAFHLRSEANGVRIAGHDTGKPVLIDADARLVSGDFAITAANARFGAAEAGFAGEARRDHIAGRATLTVPDLEDFSALTERPLAGRIALGAEVTGNPAERSLDLAISGTGTGLSIGTTPLDRLLGSAFDLSGEARLSPASVALDDIKLRSTGVELEASGTLSTSSQSQLTGSLKLDDLARIDERLSGAATFAAVATGSPWAPEIAVTASVPSGAAFGRTLESVAARYAGRIPEGALAGSVVFEGRVAGLPISATARIAGYPDTLDISELSARIASVAVTGALALQQGTLPTGTLTVSAPRLAELTPLIGAETTGSLNATITLPTTQAGGFPRVAANIVNLRVGRVSISRLSVTADEFDAAARRASGNVSGNGLRIGDLAVDTIGGRITGDPSGLGMDLEFALPDGTARFAGDLRRDANGAVLALRSFAASRDGETLRLAEPVDLKIVGGQVSFTNLALTGGPGRAEISGAVGNTLDLAARADGLPLSAIGLFLPRFGLGGRIDGTATISGPYSDLAGAYDLRVGNLSFGELRRAGITALHLSAAGRFAGTHATARGRIAGPGGLALDFDGTVPVDGTGNLDLGITGALELADVNRALRMVGADLSGQLRVNGRLDGPLARPGFAGTLGLSGGRYADRAAGLAFNDLEGSATADGQRLTLRALTATAANGGRISASGSVMLGGSGGPVADVEARAENARVIASSAATLDVTGMARLRGSLANMPTISGNLTVNRLDVELPRRLPQRVATLDVKHRNAPRDLQRIATGRNARNTGDEAGNFDAMLDLAISAPGRIFIRGQGLDAELEGDIVLRGTLASPATQGAFRLRRGSMSVLAQRFDISSATLAFAGDVDPALDIVSRTRAADIMAIFTVTGTASAPEFRITSEPPMAEDEILSRVLFDKASADLTAGEAIALAQAASQLAGFSTGPGFLDTLRRKTGLDRLTVSTDAEGNPVVDAGRYVSDRAYLGVRQGATADSTRATVDIDITRELKAHGEIGTDGQSKFGVTVEREY